jgi:hypothetical protein
MNEVHFKLDSITRITLVKRKPNRDYYWADARPEKRGFFGLILLQKALPAGWTYSGDERYSLADDILRYNWYGFDEAKNEIYIKPYVEIRLLEQGEISHRFNSDSDAITWIDDIVAQAGSKFVVIGR